MADFLTGDYQPLLKRKISEDTVRKFGYRVGTDNRGNAVQIADYRSADGTLVAQKIRGADKKFTIVGDGKNLPLWGQHLWREGGRRIVVTEGEIDALSVAEAVGRNWPVVSIPSGAQSAKKAIQNALEFLSTFETVVFAYDMDEPGRAAAAECAPLLPPGKAAIAELPLKDANECLVAGLVKELSSCLWQARVYRPGGIVNGSELWDKMRERQAPGLPYPWKGLTKMTYGQHPGRLVTWTSGTGMGKSTAVAQVAYDLAFPKDLSQEPLTVGYVALEESVGRTAQRFVGHYLGKLVHLPGMATEEELKGAFDATLGTGRVWLHEHFGSVEQDDLLGKLRYMIVSCGCRVLVIDHLSIIISGMSLSDDERRSIDLTMTRLRTLVEETGVTLHLVSHLRRASGDNGAEEGARVTLAQLRGSQSIAQLSDYVIALERNQQNGSKAVTVRVLKNRVSGDTGVACKVEYNTDTGRLEEIVNGPDEYGFKDESGDSDF